MVNVPNASLEAMTNARLPIFLNFSIGNSIPTTNKSKITPISANKFRTSKLRIKLKGGVKGPIIIPAMIYPITMGCLSLYETIAITDATIIIIVKSCKKGPISTTIL